MGKIGELVDDDLGPGRHDRATQGIRVIGVDDHGMGADRGQPGGAVVRSRRARDLMAGGDEPRPSWRPMAPVAPATKTLIHRQSGASRSYS